MVDYIENINIGQDIHIPDGETWTTAAKDSNLGSHNWEALTYGNNKFVALGYDGYISTSTDGTTWTTATQNTNLGSNRWISVAYGNNKFVALGEVGYISTSIDGETWTTAAKDSNLGSHIWNALTYGNNKFVALGYDGYTSTSTDGETWTAPTQNTNLGSNSWYAISYGVNKFIVLGNAGYISTSTDGETWTTAVQYSNLSSHNWRNIAYGNNKFVALGGSGYISTTTDGVTWTTSTQVTNLGSHDWTDLAYDNDKFVAIGSGGYISTSPNLTTQDIPIGGDIQDGHWVLSGPTTIDSGKSLAPGKMLGPYDLSTYLPDKNYIYEILLRVDGRTGTTSGNNFRPSLAAGSYSSASDIPSYEVIQPQRCKTVSSSNQRLSTQVILTIYPNDQKFCLYNSSGAAGTATNIALEFHGYKRIGTNGELRWSDLRVNEIGGYNWNAITYGANKFVTLGQSGRVGISSDGGETWSSSAITNLGSHAWYAIAYGNNTFAALGATGYVSTSTDGITWTAATQHSGLGSNNWAAMTCGTTGIRKSFVALSSTGYISSSLDGIYWDTATQSTELGSNGWSGIAYGNGKFVAIGGLGYVSTSTNGYTWTTAEQKPNLSVVSGWTVTFDGTKFIAVSNQGWEATSTDGGYWMVSKHRKLCKNSPWTGVAAGGDSAVVISTIGTISVLNLLEQPVSYIDIGQQVNIKPDGENWTTPVQALASSSSWQSLAFDGTKFVALGGSGYISTTTDGVTWTTPTQVTNLGSHDWTDLVYGNGKFVAIGSDGYISTSTDGTTWTVATQVANLGSGRYWFSIEYIPWNTQTVASNVISNSGMFVAQGIYGYMSTSTDGTTWTAATQASALNANSRQWTGLHEFNSALFSFGFASSKNTAISRVGNSRGVTANWSTAVEYSDLGLEKTFKGVAHDSEKIVAMERYGYITTSTDSVNWSTLTAIDTLANKGYWQGLAYGNNTYVAVSTDGYVSTSPDIKSSRIPIGGEKFRGKMHLTNYPLTSSLSLKSTPNTIDIGGTGGLLPDDGFDYEIQGSMQITTPSTKNTGVYSSLQTANHNYSWVDCCITRTSSTELCNQSFHLIVPANDRTIVITPSNTSNRASTTSSTISHYRRVYKNE